MCWSSLSTNLSQTIRNLNLQMGCDLNLCFSNYLGAGWWGSCMGGLLFFFFLVFQKFPNYCCLLPGPPTQDECTGHAPCDSLCEFHNTKTHPYPALWHKSTDDLFVCHRILDLLWKFLSASSQFLYPQVQHCPQNTCWIPTFTKSLSKTVLRNLKQIMWWFHFFWPTEAYIGHASL